jgi:hypothetical protein
MGNIKQPRGEPPSLRLEATTTDQVKGGSVIGVSVPEGAVSSISRSKLGVPKLVPCFRHEGEQCPRCDGLGYRPRKRCEGCGVLSGRPSEGGKALMGLRNRRGWDQPFYCLSCHPELDHRLTTLERIGGDDRPFLLGVRWHALGPLLLRDDGRELRGGFCIVPLQS